MKSSEEKKCLFCKITVSIFVNHLLDFTTYHRIHLQLLSTSNTHRGAFRILDQEKPEKLYLLGKPVSPGAMGDTNVQDRSMNPSGFEPFLSSHTPSVSRTFFIQCPNLTGVLMPLQPLLRVSKKKV